MKELKKILKASINWYMSTGIDTLEKYIDMKCFNYFDPVKQYKKYNSYTGNNSRRIFNYFISKKILTIKNVEKILIFMYNKYETCNFPFSFNIYQKTEIVSFILKEKGNNCLLLG